MLVSACMVVYHFMFCEHRNTPSLHMAITEEDKEMFGLFCSVATLGSGSQVLVVRGLQAWSL